MTNLYSSVSDEWSYELVETLQQLMGCSINAKQMDLLYSYLLLYSTLTHNFCVTSDNRTYNKELNELNLQLFNLLAGHLEVPTLQYYYRKFYDGHRSVFNSIKTQIRQISPVTGEDLELKGMVIRI